MSRPHLRLCPRCSYALSFDNLAPKDNREGLFWMWQHCIEWLKQLGILCLYWGLHKLPSGMQRNYSCRQVLRLVPFQTIRPSSQIWDLVHPVPVYRIGKIIIGCCAGTIPLKVWPVMLQAGSAHTIFSSLMPCASINACTIIHGDIFCICTIQIVWMVMGIFEKASVNAVITHWWCQSPGLAQPTHNYDLCGGSYNSEIASNIRLRNIIIICSFFILL